MLFGHPIAIDAGFYATWLDLTSDLVRKKLPKSLSMAKGHMLKTKMNIRLTKTKTYLPHI